LAGEKTWPDHFGVTDTGNPVGDRGTKSAHSDRPSVRVCMRVGIKRFTKVAPFNAKDARRRIARKLID